MNRHQKRQQKVIKKRQGPAPAAVLETLGAIQDFAETVEKLKPYLAFIQQIATKVDDTIAVIRDVEVRNEALKAELALQREVTLRLVSRTIGSNPLVGNIRLLEAQIQDEILAESARAAAEKESRDGPPTEPTEYDSPEDPSSGAEI